ncbi:MAG: M50 family metallopeptidase, partial [Pyrinomonadaceae bacterium]
RNFPAKNALLILACLIGSMTLLFGLITPLFNISDEAITLQQIGFTFLVGSTLSAGLFFLAFRCSPKVQNFAVAFLAVQLVLNALFDLKTLFLINAPLIGSNIHTDAKNMEQLTNIPAIVWVLIWIAISVLIVSITLRLYAISQKDSQRN